MKGDRGKLCLRREILIVILWILPVLTRESITLCVAILIGDVKAQREISEKLGVGCVRQVFLWLLHLYFLPSILLLGDVCVCKFRVFGLS